MQIRKKTGFAIGWAYLVLIIYITLTPSPPAGPEIPFADKWEHLAAYALLMAWFGWLEEAQRPRIYYAVGFCALGALLELLQGLGGVRQMELADALANATGVGLGWLALKFLPESFPKPMA